MTRLPYDSDLPDDEWALIEPFVKQQPGPGRKRTVDTREIVNALCYMTRTGCQWRFLPHDFPAWELVSYYYYQWLENGTLERVNDALREDLRIALGKEVEPSVAIMDSQSVKTAAGAGVRGFDSAKRIKGRKRHVLSDTQGLPLEMLVTTADVSDSQGARWLWQRAGRRRGATKKLRRVWVDAGYKRGVQEWCAEQRGVVLQGVEKEPGQRGFAVQKRRWVIERTFGWFSAHRRLAKDYEVLPHQGEGLLWFASLRVLLRRLA